MKRLRMCLIVALALLLVTVSVAGASGNANPGVLPPSSQVQGRTYGEWSTAVWRYFFETPVSENPIFGAPWTDCYLERVGNVGLAVPFTTSGSFTCEMPAGTILYLLVVASECSTVEPPTVGGSEEELLACAQSYVPSDLQASIDGVALRNVSDYVVTSPLFEFTLPDDNLFGLPGGTTAQSIAYGTFLMLVPLSPGQHTLWVHGAIPSGGFLYDMTYYVTVIN